MPWLLMTSFVWAFSFGLIKKHLGGMDAGFVALVRLGLSFLLFLPMLRPRRAPSSLAVRLVLIGAVEFGLMYVFYIQSFRHLAAHQVALFTIFTPLYVTLADDALEKRFRPLHFWTALLAVAGTAVIVYSGWATRGRLAGFALVQASNACFAAGQVAYRRLAVGGRGWRDRDVFAWLYLGGAAAAALSWLAAPGTPAAGLAAVQVLVLAYLGLLASGMGFFLWNIGSSQVSAGTLAVTNNLKVPLAVIVSLLCFGERADLLRLGVGGGAILLALYLNDRSRAERG